MGADGEATATLDVGWSKTASAEPNNPAVAYHPASLLGADQLGGPGRAHPGPGGWIAAWWNSLDVWPEDHVHEVVRCVVGARGKTSGGGVEVAPVLG